LLSRNPVRNETIQKLLAVYVYPHLVLLRNMSFIHLFFETYFSSVSGGYRQDVEEDPGKDGKRK
jgi:hypothetical protein